MKKYHLLNNIIGWGICLIACIVFILTAEPTTSWWDCGEYITTAYKLQVGHPPGAPTFQLIGRFFSMFAFGNTMNVAYAINVMSALCSGFTILFLFWSITLLAKKLVLPKGTEMTPYKMWTVFACGAIGALAYTFSDTFWFSAVEGEVYAMSSFFTAIVFWVILKWEEQADSKHSLRWLILIAFLIGLAIGVHLLNLLAIPAVVLVYYFKKYPKATTKGVILALLLSIALVGGILNIIVPWIVILAGNFEVFAVNGLGFPFNTGTIIYFIILFGGIAWALWWSIRKKKAVWNTIILSFIFILIGYSSFFILVIRANANTPLNENAPKDAVALRAYLGREQYGSRPLLYGNYYNVTREDVVKYKEGYQKYVRGEDKYEEAGKSGGEQVFKDGKSTIFPRMSSTDETRNHSFYYKAWAKVKGTRTPTFGDNLTFFFRYQVNYMYWRYFLWNFAGRQNDIQGMGYNKDETRDLINGNWITGIKFWDEARLGPQDNLPGDLANNKGKNVFYCLPLLLGLIGLVFHFRKSKKDTFVVFLLFFMTGLAIILYLNEPPIEPRERDYTYAGSFYAFAIWIGLGVMAISDFLSKKLPKMLSIGITFLVCLLLVPCLMAKEGWNDHDRSKKYAARDFSANYIDSCEPNSILITYGDNDTFPLWFVQEVEGKRTDVRILNYTLSGMYWYVEQLYNTLYDSKALSFTLPFKFYQMGQDQVFLQDRLKDYVELKDALEMLKSERPEFKGQMSNGETVYVIPFRKFKITLDIPKLVAKGIIPAEMAATISPEIRWEINKEYLERNELMFLDILATNAFERPIYSMGMRELQKVFSPITSLTVQEGMLDKLVPYQTEPNTMNLDKSYDLLVNKAARWGNLNDPRCYVDPISFNNGQVGRDMYKMLGYKLFIADRKADAEKALDKGLAFFPHEKIALDIYTLEYARLYHLMGKPDKAKDVMDKIAKYYEQRIRYCEQFKGEKTKNVETLLHESLSIYYSNIYALSKELKFDDIAKRAEGILQKYMEQPQTQVEEPQQPQTQQ